MSKKTHPLFTLRQQGPVVSCRADDAFKQKLREIAFREDVGNSHVLLEAAKRGLPILEKELQEVAAN